MRVLLVALKCITACLAPGRKDKETITTAGVGELPVPPLLTIASE
jgi:hypothetical protein